MAIITFKQINSKFSNIIGEYIRKGYIISCGTMGNILYSGEICHVDLINSKNKNDLVRVWLINGREKSTQILDSVYTVKLAVMKYDLRKKRTLWYENGELIGNEYKYYEVRNKQAYTDSADESKFILNLRYSRYENRYVKPSDKRDFDLNKVPMSVKNKILDSIKQTKGARRANSFDCIKRISLRETCHNGIKRLQAEAYWEFNNKNGYIYFK